MWIHSCNSILDRKFNKFFFFHEIYALSKKIARKWLKSSKKKIIKLILF